MAEAALCFCGEIMVDVGCDWPTDEEETTEDEVAVELLAVLVLAGCGAPM